MSRAAELLKVNHTATQVRRAAQVNCVGMHRNHPLNTDMYRFSDGSVITVKDKAVSAIAPPKLGEESRRTIRLLLDSSRTAPKILADDYLSQVGGMIGLACTESLIDLDEHAAYWAEIGEIKDARELARKAALEVVS